MYFVLFVLLFFTVRGVLYLISCSFSMGEEVYFYLICFSFSQGEEEDLYTSVRVRRKDYEDVEDRHQVSFWFRMISGLTLV